MSMCCIYSKGTPQKVVGCVCNEVCFVCATVYYYGLASYDREVMKGGDAPFAKISCVCVWFMMEKSLSAKNALPSALLSHYLTS